MCSSVCVSARTHTFSGYFHIYCNSPKPDQSNIYAQSLPNTPETHELNPFGANLNCSLDARADISAISSPSIQDLSSNMLKLAVPNSASDLQTVVSAGDDQQKLASKKPYTINLYLTQYIFILHNSSLSYTIHLYITQYILISHNTSLSHQYILI